MPAPDLSVPADVNDVVPAPRERAIALELAGTEQATLDAGREVPRDQRGAFERGEIRAIAGERELGDRRAVAVQNSRGASRARVCDHGAGRAPLRRAGTEAGERGDRGGRIGVEQHARAFERAAIGARRRIAGLAIRAALLGDDLRDARDADDRERDGRDRADGDGRAMAAQSSGGPARPSCSGGS